MYTFRDFKGFADAQLALNRPLTLLIGKNGAGKSNLLEGIELLAQLVTGRSLHEITDISRGGAFEIRGGLSGCIRQGQKSFSLGWKGAIRLASGSRNIDYAISINNQSEPLINEERLAIDGRSIFQTRESEGRIIKVQYDNFSTGPNKPIASLAADRSALSQYAQFAEKVRRKSIVEDVARVRNHLERVFLFDPQPKEMRGYERIGNRQLLRNGANISAALYHMHQQRAFNRENKQPDPSMGTSELGNMCDINRILSWIRQLPEEPYESFQFVTTQLNDVIFGLKDPANQDLLDARLLSDGTLRCLAVLTALETVESGARLFVEEFDNGLHASRVGILLDAIWEAARRRNLNVLATTHNPVTLDTLKQDQLKGVTLCFYDKKIKSSRTLALLELPRADVLLEQGQLGDLVTRKVLDSYILPESEQDKEIQYRKWMEKLP